MKTLRLELVDHGMTLTVGAADVELNTYYNAAAQAFIQPIALRLELGKVSEEEQLEIAMRTYAVGVVLGSDPEMSEEELFQWFRKHPEEFDIIVSVADFKENFTENGNSAETTGETSEQGLEEAG